MKLETISDRLNDRGITLCRVVEGKDNTRTRLFTKCNTCEHEWNASLQSVIYHKTGCPKCGRNRIIASCTKHRKTNESIDHELLEKSIDTIKRCGNYINNTTPIEWVCIVCEHKWITSPNDILHSGHRCVRCSKRERVTDELIDQRLVASNRYIVRRSTSNGCMAKLTWECVVCSGQWQARPNDVFSTHKSGCPYCKRKSYSNVAIAWLKDIEKQQGINIQHAGNGNEFKIPGTRMYADGYCASTNTIYEFYGDRFHGNPNLYKSDDTCHPYDPTCTAGILFRRTIKKEEVIRKQGYNLVTIWEVEYRQMKQL